MPLKCIFGKTGVVLSFLNVPAFVILEWWGYSVWAATFKPSSPPIEVWHLISFCVFGGLTAGGLILYIYGRTGFWAEAEWRGRTLILAAILSLLGVWVTVFSLDALTRLISNPSYISQPPDLWEPWTSFIYMTIFSLWILTGVLWIVDFVKLPREGTVGAMIATASFLIYVYAASGQTFAIRSVDAANFSNISIASLLLTLAGIVMSAISILKKYGGNLNDC